MNNTTTNNVEATYRTSLYVWNEFTIYDALLQTTQSYLDEIHDCGNLYSPDFEELGELRGTGCRSHCGGLNPAGDRLSDVDWNEIAEEWYESGRECFEDSLNWEETR